jgi:hypothetical protein
LADGQVLVILAAGRARRYGGVKPLAPVGTNGEAVIDLLAGDALSAGFSTIVIVVGPSTGAAIRYHVEHTWPATVDVRFALQEAPLGTVHAVLSSAGHLGDGQCFGVANADDLYGRAPLALLAEHLTGGRGNGAGTNALVGFRLRNAVIGEAPVTRGVCEVDGHGMLRSVVERRQVSARGGRFVSEDGMAPAEIDGDALVSMNLWGFGPEMLEVMADEMDADEHASEDAEVLLPDVVARALSGRRGPPAQAFRVLEAEGRCIGVTHPDDLSLVQADVAGQVGRGERPALPFPPGAP